MRENLNYLIQFNKGSKKYLMRNNEAKDYMIHKISKTHKTTDPLNTLIMILLLFNCYLIRSQNV